MNGHFPDPRTAARILGGEVDRTGSINCPGPWHSPQDRSLWVTLNKGPDGLLVESRAGDDPIACKDYVREKLGAETWKPNGAARHNGSDAPKPKITAEYTYRQADGALYLRVLRTEAKTFLQKHWNGSAWAWGKPKGPKIPYRLPEMLAAPHDMVFVCEGEKDADCLASHGFTATTSSEGAGKWTPDLNPWFAGRTVCIVPDNDDPGRNHARQVAENLHGVAAEVRIVTLPGVPEKGDASDWIAAGNDPRELLRLSEAAPVWQAQQSDADTEDGEPLPFVDVAAWDGAPVPVREWAVLDVIPAKNVTLLTGQGGGGKTTLASQLCAATVLGRDWLTHLPEPGKAIIICCEDDVDEMHRRFDRIAAYYGVSFRDLAEGGLLPMSLAGRDAVLAAPDRSGTLRPTPLFHQIAKAARTIRPNVIVLDNAADVYAGNENERGMVRQFITLLRGLAIDTGAAVLLTLHPSLTGISTGTGMSGNTAWFNSVRGQLYLKSATTDEGETPDADLRELEARKNNYGPLASTLMLRWRDGVFVVERSTGGTLDRMAADQTADDLFLKLLDRFNRQSRNVNDKRSVSYAPTLFAKEQDAKDAGVNRKAFEAAMARLFAANQIRLEQYGRPSNPHFRLVREENP